MKTATAPERSIGVRLGDLPPRPAFTPPVIPPDPEGGAAWLSKFKDALTVLTNMTGTLTCPPPGTPLADLLSFMELLPLNHHDIDPVRGAAARQISRWVWTDNTRLTDTFVDMLRDVVSSIGKRLAAGEDDPNLIDARLFKQTRFIDSGWISTEGKTVWHLVGLLDYLPDGDPRTERYRTLLPAEDFYLANGFNGVEQKALILGVAGREWYTVDVATKLTLQARKQQLQKQRDRDRDELLDLQAELRKEQDSDLGRFNLFRKKEMERDAEDLRFQIAEREKDADHDPQEVTLMKIQLRFLEGKLGVLEAREIPPPDPAILPVSGKVKAKQTLAELEQWKRRMEEAETPKPAG